MYLVMTAGTLQVLDAVFGALAIGLFIVWLVDRIRKKRSFDLPLRVAYFMMFLAVYVRLARLFLER